MDEPGETRTTEPEAAQADADVVVVGSGFGGAVAACRLAQAGFAVVLLERGRRYESGDFPPLPGSGDLLPDSRRWLWGPEHGLWDVEDLGEIVSMTAAGYGGGSLIYANVHLRPPRQVFDERWPRAYQQRRGLDDYFDLVASMLEVAPLDENQLPKVSAFEGAAKREKRTTFHPPLAIRRKTGPNQHGVLQRACIDCGACCTGCPVRAKNTLDLNYLALAERHGTRALTQCEVVGLEQRADKAWVVRYVDHLAATTKVLIGSNVFLCAGATHSTRLLFRWEHERHKGRQEESRRESDSLIGVGFSPGGDALGMVYDTKERVEPSRGPTITTSVVQWQDAAKGRFFLLQDGGYAEQLARLSGLLRAPAWVGRNRLTRSSAPIVSADPRQVASAAVDTEVPSMIDQLLDALSSRLIDESLGSHRQDFASFIKELQGPLLLSAVVERTIELAVLERYRRGLLTAWISKDSRLMKWLVKVDKCALNMLYGGVSALTDHASLALLTAGGLSRHEIVKRVLGYEDIGAQHRLMLLAMGRDAAPGLLEYDPTQDKLLADLDLFYLVPGYSEQERLMADIAGSLGGELRTNPAWTFLGKPITVHNQGGCPMADSADQGVTDPDGKVYGVEGLYVMDGGVLCASVGVNPSATIAAVAERNVLTFINSQKRYREAPWPGAHADAGAREYLRHVQAAKEWKVRSAKWHIEPPPPRESPPRESPPREFPLGIHRYRAQPLGIAFDEEMRGYIAKTDDLLNPPDKPKRDVHSLTEDEYLALERRGRPSHPVCARLSVQAPSLARFIEDERHRLRITGTVDIRLPGEDTPRQIRVRGHLELFVQRRKPHALSSRQWMRRKAQEHFTGVTYGAGRLEPGALAPKAQADEQFMLYELTLVDAPGWRLTGYKRLSDKPGLQAWRDLSCLHIKLWRLKADQEYGELMAAGAIRVDLMDFLSKQLPSIRATGTVDPARRVWAAGRFATYFFGTLQRVYFAEFNTALKTLFGSNSAKVERGEHSPYFSDLPTPRDLAVDDVWDPEDAEP